jgi:hypothetical protein
MTLTIKDETMTGSLLNAIELNFMADIVTVKDIIESRVNAEVKKFNKQRDIVFNGFVQPSNAERQLNGSFRVREHKPIDAEKQVYVALEAFQRNGFFVLINDKQAETLEQAIVLRKDMTISFVKLTPLVGG